MFNSGHRARELDGKIILLSNMRIHEITGNSYMAMNTMISEGHSNFYTAYGLTIALVIMPFIQSWIPIQSGLGVEIDSLLTIAGLSGIITGLLFVISPDKIADKWIKHNTTFESWRDLVPFKKIRNCNSSLKNLVAIVDQTAANWDKPAWNSTSDSVTSMVETSIDAPNIQKALWNLKRRASIGLLFCMWSCALWIYTGSLSLYWFIVGVFTIGLSILFHTLFWGTSKQIIGRVGRYSFVSYASDSFQNYQHRRYWHVRDEDALQIIESTKDSSIKLQQLAESHQWKRFDKVYDWYIHELKKTSPRFINARHRCHSAWMGAFSEYCIAKSQAQDTDRYKSWLLGVVESYSLTGVLENINLNPLPNNENFSDSDSFFANLIDTEEANFVYRNYDSALTLLKEAFETISVEEKVNWINTLSTGNRQVPRNLSLGFYNFACEYEGDGLGPESYWRMIKRTSRIELTSPNFVQKIAELPISTREELMSKLDFFKKLLASSGVDSETNKVAKKHARELDSQLKFFR